MSISAMDNYLVMIFRQIAQIDKAKTVFDLEGAVIALDEILLEARDVGFKGIPTNLEESLIQELIAGPAARWSTVFVFLVQNCGMPKDALDRDIQY